MELLEQIGAFSYGVELHEISDQATSEAALEMLLKKVIAVVVDM
jgi:hypothetical protein